MKLGPVPAETPAFWRCQYRRPSRTTTDTECSQPEPVKCTMCAVDATARESFRAQKILSPRLLTVSPLGLQFHFDLNVTVPWFSLLE